MTDPGETIHWLTARAADAGERLDRFLAGGLPGSLSRARLKLLIESGHVAAAGQTITEPSHRVKPGQAYRLSLPPAADPTPRGQAIALQIVYEDADLIVIDKPAGMVVHPAPGNPDATLVNALIAHCGASLSGIGGVRRPGIVHRIDKDTSGLLVAAKHDAAHAGLARLFAAHTIERGYRALIWGAPAPIEGVIEGNIGRDPNERKRMAVVGGGGKPALTRYRLERRLGGLASLLDCRLATGRTHQVRVHLAHIGHPLIGDPLYGRRRGSRLNALPEAAREQVAALRRQALHAWLLGFRHPVSGRALRFESPLPDDMRDLISALTAAG
ncbi:MAG TPA: RluA family pseudouridine synthase [Candidatus Sulfotelmatobacter sp.]|nr:RluA family pseudouridine synthase [Candidatus Sulfotelmatobacter sp.]